MSKDFTPNFDHIQADASITEASKFARKMLTEYVKQYAEFKGITQTQIAQATGFTQGNVSRILSAKYSPTLDNFLKIAGAVGVRLEIMQAD